MPSLAAALAVALLAAACGRHASPTAPITTLPRELTPAERTVITASNAFGFDLFDRVAAADTTPNVVLSPLSASMVLGMMLNGAAGDTWTGIQQALHFGSLSQAQINDSYRGLLSLLTGLDPKVQLGIANAVWTNQSYPVLPSFADTVKSAFDAQAQSANFSDPTVVNAINNWVSGHTGGRIDRIIDSINPMTVALLLNAVYFKGTWTVQFDPKSTQTGPFTRADGSTVQVPLMHLTDQRLPYAFTSAYQAVDLGYGGGAFSMTVVVPRPGVTLGDVVSGLDAGAWAGLVASMDSATIDVTLPRFTERYDRYLNDPLAAMGMRVAFTPQADFSRLSTVPACVSFVRQKTYVHVDEAGTEAAAVTAGGIVATAAPPSVDATRPFLFVIRERLSGTILFMGTVGDPSVSQAPAPPPPGETCPP